MKRAIFVVLSTVLVLAACSQAPPTIPSSASTVDVAAAVQATLTAWPSATPPAEAGILFDDFSYAGSDDPSLTGNGWIPRDTQGGPGIPGAAWASQNIS